MKELIGRFHGIILTAAEYAAIQDYLFGTGVRPPLPDEGVLSTVDFLKELAEESDFRSCADIHGYFDGQAAKYDAMIRNLIQSENN